jgi:hypothetical protein
VIPRSEYTLHKVDEDDKELLYRAIYTSMEDPKTQRMFHTMSANVVNAFSIGPAPERGRPRSRALDIEETSFPGKEKKATVGECTVARDATNNSLNSTRDHPQKEDKLEEDRNERDFEAYTGRLSNPPLHLIQHDHQVILANRALGMPASHDGFLLIRAEPRAPFTTQKRNPLFRSS